MKKIYIGLNDNFHDPSICILDEQGDILFAEGVERPLQSKRGIGCPADLDIYVEKVLENLLAKEKYHVFVASSWSKKKHVFSKFFDLIGFFNYDANAIFRRILKKFGVHRIFHLESARAASAIAQSGAGIYAHFENWSLDSIVERRYYNHHLTHIVNAVSCSNFSDGIGLVIDGGGEATAISIYKVENREPILIKSIHSAFSLGAMYGVSTNAIGFSGFKGEEWKVMGLAPYGKNNLAFEKLLKDVFRVKNNKFTTKTRIVGKYQEDLREIVLTQNVAKEDAAHTVQHIFSEYLFNIVNYAIELIPNQRNIIISGGAALNSSSIGELSESGLFDNVVVANAPADDGNSIGAALLAFKEINGQFPNSYKNRSPFLGSEINQTSLEKYVVSSRLPFKKVDDPSCYGAKLLSENKIIGWIQGRAEFGPRALGNRSILAHPGFAENKDRINAVVKFRESFRPFAPSILHEYGEEYFEKYSYSPFMEKTLTFRKEVRDKVPAVVHVNNTGRLQSVTKDINEKYYELIERFNELTGIPLIVNTSYNVMGKPIVHDLNDVMSVFFSSSIDAVIINNYVIERNDLK
ncbi:MAG: carbamoyltransferase [Flavobacteriales bacterium]